MLEKRTILLLIGTAISSVGLTMGQEEETETPGPIVDPKYGAASDIMSMSPADLVTLLEDPQGSVFAKAKACQRLAVVGSTEAVPALEALLTDPQLSHYARFALEPIDDDAPDQALRSTLDKVEGKLLIGIINSIGRRQDAEALPALAALLNHSDRKVAHSAAEAMRRIRPAF